MCWFIFDFLQNFKYWGLVFRVDCVDYWIVFCICIYVKVEGLVRLVVGVWEVESLILNRNMFQFILKRFFLILN